MRQPGKKASKTKPGAKPRGAKPEEQEPKRHPSVRSILGQSGKRRGGK